MAFFLNRWIYNKKEIIQLTIWFSDEENGCTICIQRSLTFLRQLRKSNQWYFSPADVIYTFLWVSISHKCQCLFPKRWPDLCYMTVNYVMLLFNNERSRGKLFFFDSSVQQLTVVSNNLTRFRVQLFSRRVLYNFVFVQIYVCCKYIEMQPIGARRYLRWGHYFWSLSLKQYITWKLKDYSNSRQQYYNNMANYVLQYYFIYIVV